MTKYNSTYYTKFFATRRYFGTLVIMILTGIVCLYLATLVLPSVIRYAGMNQTIKDAENYAEQFGWTDYRKAEVDALKAERDEFAKNDEIFKWCLTSSETKTGKFFRNWILGCVGSMFILGIGLVSFAIYVPIRDIGNLPKNPRPRRRMQTKMAEITVDTTCEVEFIRGSGYFWESIDDILNV